MDPDEALEKARDALKRHFARIGDDAADDLAEAFEALDGWLSKGGFPPRDWGRNFAPADTESYTPGV